MPSNKEAASAVGYGNPGQGAHLVTRIDRTETGLNNHSPSVCFSGGQNPFEGMDFLWVMDPFEIFETNFLAVVFQWPTTSRRTVYSLALRLWKPSKGVGKKLSILAQINWKLKFQPEVDDGMRVAIRGLWHWVVFSRGRIPISQRDGLDIHVEARCVLSDAVLATLLMCSTIDGEVET